MATNERVEKLRIRIQLEQQKLEQAKKGFADFSREFQSFKAESEKTNRALEEQVRVLQQEKIAAQQSQRAVQSQVKGQRDVKNAVEDTTRALKEQKKTAADLADENFSRISQQVGLFGDTQSNLGAIRGLAGAAGLGGVDQVLGVAGEVAALGEELPRLKTALAGLPAQIGAAAQALGPVGLGLGATLIAFTVIIAEVQRRANEAAEAVRRQIDAELEADRVIRGATTPELTKAYEDQQKVVTDLEADLALAQSKLDAINEQFKDLSLSADEVLELNSQYYGQKEQIEELTKQYDQASIKLREYALAFDDSRVAENDAEAEREKQRQAADAQRDRLLLTRLQTEKQFANQSVEAIDQRIEGLQRDIAANQDLINSEGLSADAKAKLVEETQNLIVQLSTLTQVSRPAAEALERLARAEEDRQRTLEETADLTKKYNGDLKNLEQQTAEARIAINDRYAEAVIAAAEQAAEAAEKALQKLREQREDLARDLARDFQDADIDARRQIVDERIKAQEDEAKALRTHLTNLKRIQQQYNRDSTAAIEDRDAVALANAQRTRNQAIKDEQQRFDDEARERQIALQQRLRDQRIAADREREDRQRDYQRRLEDAQIQYNRELAQAEQQRQQALAKAQEQYQRELTLLQQKSAAQLKIYEQDYITAVRYAQLGKDARERIMAAEVQRLNAIAQQIVANLGGLAGSSSSSSSGSSNTSYLIRRASGGSLQPFQTAAVNEPGSSGRESFTSMGKTMAFPGAGLFTPFRSGMVNANRGGGGNTANIYVQLDGKTFKTMSKQQALNALGEVLDSMGAA